MYGQISNIVNGHWSDEGHKWTHAAAEEMFPIFTAQGWTWSGEPVSKWDLQSKVLLLAYDCARELHNKPAEEYAAIGSGRVRVTARRNGPDSADFTAFLCTMVGTDV